MKDFLFENISGDFDGTILDMQVLKHCDFLVLCLLVDCDSDIIPLSLRVSPKLYNMFVERKEK